MKIVSFSLLLFAVTLSVHAQNRIVTTPLDPPVGMHQSLLSGSGMLPIPENTAATVEHISYFDISKGLVIRQFPNLQNGITLISQRFSSPSENTILDSIAVYAPTVATGHIRLDIYRDTTLLLNIQGQTKAFHFPHLYHTSQDYMRFDTALVDYADIIGEQYYTAMFHSQKVGKEFHVQFVPRRVSDAVNPAYTLLMSMDSLKNSELTTENSRVCYVLLTYDTGIYWENAGPPETQYSPSINMFASVHYDDATGIDALAIPSGLAIDGFYPHPVSEMSAAGTTLAFTLAVRQNIDISVYDIMGRKVRTVINTNVPAGSQLVNLSTIGLAPGTYAVLLKGEHAVATKTLVIVK